jgi:PEP-CTERM motif
MGLFGKYGIAVLAALCLVSAPASAGTLEYVVTYTFTPATGQADIFAGNDVDVNICQFCVYTFNAPWDLYITDGSGNVVNHLFSVVTDPSTGRTFNEFDFSAGAPGGADPSIGQPCPDPSLCQVQDPSGLTDVTNLFNSQVPSDIGGIDGMTVQSVPEPASLAFCGIGILGLWGLRRRRAR